ncbi:hypothetical protein HJG60_011159 [Phyllostomus discolor]|uniref:Uncharacterized protein n=1 Tax=Phyllostomus discolor TaxID=89673 RepID=A0A833ZW58_9CHIR|nr:hypothetical protein HJG60_011159 [Phyllostomus discolor]
MALPCLYKSQPSGTIKASDTVRKLNHKFKINLNSKFSCFFFLFFIPFKNLKIFYCCSSTVVSIFTLPCPPPHPSPSLTLEPTSLGLCPCVLCTRSLMAILLLSLSTLLSGNCQFVLYFNVSGCILLAD